MLLVSSKLSPTEIFRDARTVLLRNQNVLIVLFVDLKIIESLSVCIKIKRGVAQQRHDATNKNKYYKNICCVCKQKYETACNCVKCNSGRYCSRDCQYEQFNEQEKLRNYSATDNEALPTKLWNKFVKKLLQRDP